MRVQSIAQSIREASRRVLGKERDDPAIQALVVDRAKQYAKGIQRLKTVQPKTARQRLDMNMSVLRSFNSRFCAVVREANARNLKLALAEIEEIAGSIHVYRDCGEKIGTHLEPKSDGTIRETSVYRLKRSALQSLVLEVLQATIESSDHEYCREGRGPARAIQKAISLINDENREFVVTTDIKVFHPSLKKDGLQGLLGLTQSVINNVIFKGKEESLSESSLSTTSDQTAQQGLPMGARPSAFVASTVLRDLFDDLTASDAAIIYADNILVACKTKEEAVAVYEALKARLANHPAGPFELHHTEIKHVSEGVNYLGYNILQDPGSPTARAKPTRAHFDNFFVKLRRCLREASVSNLDNLALDLAREFRATWTAYEPKVPATELTHSDLEELALDAANDEWRARETGLKHQPDPLFQDLPW